MKSSDVIIIGDAHHAQELRSRLYAGGEWIAGSISPWNSNRWRTLRRDEVSRAEASCAEALPDIELQIGRASAVVVIWSPNSVRIPSFTSLAKRALGQNKLVQVVVEGGFVPEAFKKYQATNSADGDWQETVFDWVNELAPSSHYVPKIDVDGRGKRRPQASLYLWNCTRHFPLDLILLCLCASEAALLLSDILHVNFLGWARGLLRFVIPAEVEQTSSPFSSAWMILSSGERLMSAIGSAAGYMFLSASPFLALWRRKLGDRVSPTALLLLFPFLVSGIVVFRLLMVASLFLFPLLTLAFFLPSIWFGLAVAVGALFLLPVWRWRGLLLGLAAAGSVLVLTATELIATRGELTIKLIGLLLLYVLVAGMTVWDGKFKSDRNGRGLAPLTGLRLWSHPELRIELLFALLLTVLVMVSTEVSPLGGEPSFKLIGLLPFYLTAMIALAWMDVLFPSRLKLWATLALSGVAVSALVLTTSDLPSMGGDVSMKLFGLLSLHLIVAGMTAATWKGAPVRRRSRRRLGAPIAIPWERFRPVEQFRPVLVILTWTVSAWTTCVAALLVFAEVARAGANHS